jgi:hypothetical protein
MSMMCTNKICVKGASGIQRHKAKNDSSVLVSGA